MLDTNVLLHDPQSIYNFQDNNLVIPVEVLEELDSIKTEQSTERGRNARRVHRILQDLLPDSRSMHEGVELPNGGTLSVIINPYLMEPGRHSPAMDRLRAVLPDLSKQDNRIIASALFVQERFPPPTVLVTKDVNVQLKARAVGLESEDYLTDKVPEDVDEASYREIPLSIYELQRFCSEGEFEIDAKSARQLCLNEYVLLRSDEGKTMPARYYGDSVVQRLKLPEFVKAPGGIPIRARNLEQQFLMDALLDDSIHMLTCFGKAGTGKTLLSTACALHQTLDENSRYDGVSISRPVIALGKDIGFLPGTLDEKMKPWLQPYYDALEVLMPSKPPKEPQFASKKVSKKKRWKRDNMMASMSPPQTAERQPRGPRDARDGQALRAPAKERAGRDRGPLLHPRPLDREAVLHPGRGPAADAPRGEDRDHAHLRGLQDHPHRRSGADRQSLRRLAQQRPRLLPQQDEGPVDRGPCHPEEGRALGAGGASG